MQMFTKEMLTKKCEIMLIAQKYFTSAQVKHQDIFYLYCGKHKVKKAVIPETICDSILIFIFIITTN